MVIKRHAKRAIYIYGNSSSWWNTLRDILEEKTLLFNKEQTALSSEHWFVKPGPTIPSLKRSLKSGRSLICVAPDKISDHFLMALGDKHLPVFVIAPAISQSLRLTCEREGWKVVVSSQVTPQQIVDKIISYCYS